MSAPVRIALVGAGDIGRTAHLPALLAHPAVELAAVVDPDPAARALVDAPGVPVLADLGAVEADDSIAAWVVATPPWITPALTRRGLEHGRFVLAEKPIATSSAAAEAELGTLDRERLARLQVGFTYRHDPAIERLRDLIAEGALGGPLLVRVAVFDEVADPADAEHAARIRATLAHGLPVVHDGAHVADWLRVLLGPAEPEVEHAWSLRTDPELPDDNLCGASLRHPDGHRILVEVGWLLPAAVPSLLTVRGPGGCAEIDVASLRLHVADGRTVTEHAGTGDRTTRCFARQLDRFTAFCRGEAHGVPTFEDGLASLVLTERMAERMRERVA